MGISLGFNLPPEKDFNPEKVSAINCQAIEKEGKRKAAEEVRILGMIKSGKTREEAEEIIRNEEAEVLKSMIKQYPPGDRKVA